MFDKHRSHLQLQMDILEVIAVVRHEPHLLTQIQQKTGMNPQQVLRYLVEMALKGMLTVEFNPHARVARREYKITETGRILLAKYLELVKLWEEKTIKLKVEDKIHNSKA